jgi:SAM-dependent methyltransferase
MSRENAVVRINGVRDFWDAAACGESLLLKGQSADDYQDQAAERYRLEPYIRDFAGFDQVSGKQVLEIGVGLGADHEQFARGGAILTGVDITPRAVARTTERFALMGLASDISVANAEKLPFADNSFDHVYSWGVLHHTPDTPTAIAEALRVLKPGGGFRIMIYNKWSLIGLMLWTRYGLLVGKPMRSMADIYSAHLESPGTKAYTPAQALQILRPFSRDVTADVVLTHGDLLESGAGQRHQGGALNFARKIWPRWLFRRVARRNGLFLLIQGTKSI